jgi:hypothetical protein
MPAKESSAERDGCIEAVFAISATLWGKGVAEGKERSD